MKSPDSADHQDMLVEMLEQLNLGEMPPKKKDLSQPTDAQRQAVVGEIGQHLATIEALQTPAHTVLREQHGRTIFSPLRPWPPWLSMPAEAVFFR